MGTKSKWKFGRLTFYNDAVVDENVVTTTAAGTLTPYGLSVITTTAAGTYTLGVPRAGMTKDIVAGTSFVATIRCSTVANQVTIVSPSSDTQNGITITPGSTLPGCAQLRAVTSASWVLTSYDAASVALTTACT